MWNIKHIINNQGAVKRPFKKRWLLAKEKDKMKTSIAIIKNGVQQYRVSNKELIQSIKNFYVTNKEKVDIMIECVEENEIENEKEYFEDFFVAQYDINIDDNINIFEGQKKSIDSFFVG